MFVIGLSLVNCSVVFKKVFETIYGFSYKEKKNRKTKLSLGLDCQGNRYIRSYIVSKIGENNYQFSLPKTEVCFPYKPFTKPHMPS